MSLLLARLGTEPFPSPFGFWLEGETAAGFSEPCIDLGLDSVALFPLEGNAFGLFDGAIGLGSDDIVLGRISPLSFTLGVISLVPGLDMAGVFGVSFLPVF
jgi:hypothetical protein